MTPPSRNPSRSLFRALARRAAPLAVLAAVALPAAVARADTMRYSSTGSGPGIELEVTPQKVGADGQLQYVSVRSGKVELKPFDQIIQIKSAAEPTLTAAEQAFAAEKWDDAARDYGRALDTSSKDWVKFRAVRRLLVAADKSGQFGPAARAFVELAKTDVAGASTHRPAVPKDKPDQAKAALSDVERALNAGGLRPEQKSLLTTFQAEIYSALGQNDKAAALLGTGAPAPAPGPGGGVAVAAPPTAAPAGDAASRRIAADRAIQVADLAAKANNPAQVLTAIESAKANFTDPAQQARALYMLAEAKEKLAGTDPVKLQEAAIAYMRVVAHFEGAPAGTNVPAALWKVAEIQERLKNTDEAAQVYKTLANDSKLANTPMQAAAKKKLDDLRGK